MCNITLTTKTQQYSGATFCATSFTPPLGATKWTVSEVIEATYDPTNPLWVDIGGGKLSKTLVYLTSSTPVGYYVFTSDTPHTLIISFFGEAFICSQEFTVLAKANDADINCVKPYKLTFENVAGIIGGSWIGSSPSYDVYVNGNLFQHVTTNEVNFASLPTGNYTWYVIANCTSGTRIQSDTFSFSIQSITPIKRKGKNV